MKNANYILNLKLNSFIDSRIVEVEDNEGVMEKGIFIPIDKNGLRVTDRGNVRCYAFVNENQTYTHEKQTHYVRLKGSKAWVEHLKDLGYESPYIGYMRPNKWKVGKYEDNSEYVKIDGLEW